jgi:hypothetical protein
MATVTPVYNWPVPTSTDYVKDGASAIESLGDAIDASLNSITGGKNVGLQYINTFTLTSQSQLNIDNIFSSSYDSYQLVFSNMLGSSASDVNIQMRVGGTNIGGTNYQWSRIYGSYTGAVTGTGNSATGAWVSGMVVNGGTRVGATIEIYNPFLTERTSYTARSADARTSGAIGLSMSGGFINDGTSYDGISIGAGVNMSGSVSVYGFRK